MLLASYALQAEVGDYNQTLHGSDYFVPEHYLPQRVSNLIHTQISAHAPSLPPEENLQYYEAIGIFLCYSFCMYEENGESGRISYYL